MKCKIPEISWHNRDPVLSVDVQPNKPNDSLFRLATGGTDTHVLIWLLSVEKDGAASLECAADLTRHSKPVNCVRFSPSGDFLASGDDEACIIVWKMKMINDPVEFPIGEEENFKEQWISVKVLRGHLQDVYDLSWSPDSKNLISGSVDNTAILWDVKSGKNLGILGEHKGFVQGVAWDPCGQYVATMSSDRMCRVYNLSSRKIVSRIYKGHLPGADNESKPSHYFHDDTLKSFFRRLTFTPGGELLIIPSGLVADTDKTSSNSTLIFSRNCLNKPAVFLPSLNQYTVAVRCCPVLFSLRPMQSPPLFDLPYRIVIAVATQCSVMLYDTQHAAPFAFITKIHYTRLTDLSWSSNGRVLVVSSTDGYCSVITFSENELGTVYAGDEKTAESIQKKDSKTGDSSTNEGDIDTNAEKIVEDNSQKGKSDRSDLLQTKDAKVFGIVDNKKLDNNQLIGKDDTSKTQLIQNSHSSKSSDSKDMSAVPETKETEPMEVDDFQLVYEGTITEPILESKTSVQSQSIKETKCQEDLIELNGKPSVLVKESDNKPEPSTELEHKSSDKQLSQLDNKSSEPVTESEHIPSERLTESENKLSGSLIKSNNTPSKLVTNKRCNVESPNKSSRTSGSLPQEASTSPRSTSSSGPNVTPGNSNKKTPRRVQLITLSSPKSKKKLLQ